MQTRCSTMWKNLRIKQTAGAEHLLTQLFFDNMHFYRFLNLARRAGITLPVSAGVMPIVKRSQIERTVSLVLRQPAFRLHPYDFPLSG